LAVAAWNSGIGRADRKTREPKPEPENIRLESIAIHQEGRGKSIIDSVMVGQQEASEKWEWNGKSLVLRASVIDSVC
jgi:hypothetical protein